MRHIGGRCPDIADAALVGLEVTARAAAGNPPGPFTFRTAGICQPALQESPYQAPNPQLRDPRPPSARTVRAKLIERVGDVPATARGQAQ